MSNNPRYDKLAEHIGHNVVVVTYGDGENVAIECEDCCTVLVDEDREIEIEDESLDANIHREVEDWRAWDAEQALRQEHDSTCSGTLQPPVLAGIDLWVCDVCSFAVKGGAK